MNEILSHIFNYADLKKEGFVVYSTPPVDLVFTLRGNCLIDVFDLKTLKPIAYLDFDLSKSIMLASAFRSPLIGLPFSPPFRRRFETDLLPMKDLRPGHEVGFYVDTDYRNKGQKRIWNLDELMMAIAFKTALEHQIEEFTIKPTGETAPYYRKKFNAKRHFVSSSDDIMIVNLKSARKTLRHIRMIEKEGETVFFRVKGVPDFTVSAFSRQI